MSDAGDKEEQRAAGKKTDAATARKTMAGGGRVGVVFELRRVAAGDVHSAGASLPTPTIRCSAGSAAGLGGDPPRTSSVLVPVHARTVEISPPTAVAVGCCCS